MTESSIEGRIHTLVLLALLGDDIAMREFITRTPAAEIKRMVMLFDRLAELCSMNDRDAVESVREGI